MINPPICRVGGVDFGKEPSKIELTYKNPWFIKKYKGRGIITIEDLRKLIGIDIELKSLNGKNNIFRGIDWNGIGGELKENFERCNNIKYDEKTIFFVYISGFLKILKILIEDDRISLIKTEVMLRGIDDKIKNI